ncbi:Hypothetical protein CINCED_3A003477 [Cinara cedri]|uniref:Uncharacterized protein n=1 Tax=Cinara cedri TaxID=506608 RepID=A0A5E4MXT5_9HEMI|nr:Hypothetical protein CINCED_3A003477 [Cinara cedri]
MNKRKRIKFECEECGSDLKTHREKVVHDGKKVKIKHVGASLNPFEAFKRKATISVPAVPSQSVSTILVTQSPSLSFTTNMSFENVDESTIIDLRSIVDIDKSAEIETSEHINDGDESFSWMNCAGQVTTFLANFEMFRKLLKNGLSSNIGE